MRAPAKLIKAFWDSHNNPQKFSPAICTEGDVWQMLRDASDEPQDGAVLEGFGLEDLDPESLNAYRNRFASHEPDPT